MIRIFNSLRPVACLAPLLALSCDGEQAARSQGESADHLYVTSSVVFNDLGEDTYVSLLPALERHERELDLDSARELSGWAGIWTHEQKLFVSDGESPKLLRYQVDGEGRLLDDGSLSFQNQGAMFADSTFVAPNRAYVFADDAIVWNPEQLEIEASFELPRIEDLPDGMQYRGVRSGRGAVVRGNRAYVATGWANWTEYTVPEDSLIVVIDTDHNRVLDVLEAPCPYLDVASLDDDGNIYFSNWVYSLGPTLLRDRRRACAVRIRAGEDRIDTDFSLTFADVTDGREAAALRYVGDGKALISVFHHERVELAPDMDPVALSDSANWQFWMLDLNRREAEPIDGIGLHAGGFALSQIDGQSYVLVPSAEYDSTRVYRVTPDGAAEELWQTLGWSTQLLKLR